MPCILFYFQDFIGKLALIDSYNAEPATQLAQFVLNIDVHNDMWPWGTETIFCNGKAIGNVSSASFSPTLGKLLCFGQINSINCNYDAVYEIDIAGQKFGATLCNGQRDVPDILHPKVSGE